MKLLIIACVMFAGCTPTVEEYKNGIEECKKIGMKVIPAYPGLCCVRDYGGVCQARV